MDSKAYAWYNPFQQLGLISEQEAYWCELCGFLEMEATLLQGDVYIYMLPEKKLSLGHDTTRLLWVFSA